MKKFLISLLGLALLLAGFGCSGGGGGGVSASGSGTAGTTQVTIKIGQTRAPSSAGLSHVSQGIPSSVVLIRFTITGPGREQVVQEESTTGKDEISVSFSLPNGPNVDFLVEALNSRGQLIYRGFQGGVSLAGEPVLLNITMVPTDGEAPAFSGLSSIDRITTNSVVLSWQSATDNITPTEEIQYLIYVSPISGSQDFSAPPAYSPPPRGVTSFTAGGLSPDTPVCFVVRARDEWGNVDDNRVERCTRTLPDQVTPPEPPPPPPPVSVPNISVTESCADAPAPGQPILLAGIVANTGSEALANIVCSETSGAVLSGVPSTLAVGESVTISGSYVPTVSPSPSTLSCTAQGVTSETRVNGLTSPTPPCVIRTSPSLSVPQSTCTATVPPATGVSSSVTFSATITNNGNETLDSITCTSPTAAVLSGVPASLAPTASATVTASFTSPTQPVSVSLTCTGRGVISGNIATLNSSTPCQSVTLPPASISVSASCTAVEVILGLPVAAIPSPNVSAAATVANTGDPTLNTIACSSTPAATLSGVPATLAAGAQANITGSLTPSPSIGPFSVSVACSGTATTGAPVAASTQASCDWTTTMSQTGTSCVTPGAAGSTFTSTVSNSGSESINGVSCEMFRRIVLSTGIVLAPFVPPLTTTVGSVRPGQQTLVSQTVPTGISLTRQCSGAGAWSTHAVSANAVTATCPVPPTVTISGTITENTATGPAAPGVTVNFVPTGGGTTVSATTGPNGFYSMQVPLGSSGTLTPSSTGFTFTPANRTYTNVSTNQTGQNFLRFVLLF